MTKDWILGFISGLCAIAGAAGIMILLGKLHIFGAGVTGLGRLFCVY